MFFGRSIAEPTDASKARPHRSDVMPLRAQLVDTFLLSSSAYFLSVSNDTSRSDDFDIIRAFEWPTDAHKKRFYI